MKHMTLATVAFLLSSLPLHASALLTLTGKVYSSNEREIGIRQGSRVYFVDIKTFSAAGKDAVVNSKKPVTLRVNMEDITRVTVLKAEGAPKKKAAAKPADSTS